MEYRVDNAIYRIKNECGDVIYVGHVMHGDLMCDIRRIGFNFDYVSTVEISDLSLDHKYEGEVLKHYLADLYHAPRNKYDYRLGEIGNFISLKDEDMKWRKLYYVVCGYKLIYLGRRKVVDGWELTFDPSSGFSLKQSWLKEVGNDWYFYDLTNDKNTDKTSIESWNNKITCTVQLNGNRRFSSYCLGWKNARKAYEEMTKSIIDNAADTFSGLGWFYMRDLCGQDYISKYCEPKVSE